MNIQNKPTLDAVTRPVGEARGLPNAHYIDPQTHALERDKVLFATWAGIGFGKDVPNPGDAAPVDFLGMPLVLVRGEDDVVRVFQNTCRHRGMILVEKAGHIRGTIRCPYHSWCYDLNGALRSTPHVGGPGQNIHENIKRDELGLVEIRSYMWRDVVFVNISGDAPDFEEHAATVIERWKEFDQPMVPGGGNNSFKLEVNCNWKLAVENYCESYHLPWVHPGLNSYSRLEDHYNIEEQGAFSGQGTLVYRQIEGEDGQKFPDFDNLSEKWDTGAEYISLFPNVLFAVQRDHCYAILLEPKGLDKTLEHVEIYYPPAVDESYAALKAKNGEQWKGIFVEDIGVVEGMQKGRHGQFFDGGKFSPEMDGPTHLFHDWVARRLLS